MRIFIREKLKEISTINPEVYQQGGLLTGGSGYLVGNLNQNVFLVVYRCCVGWSYFFVAFLLVCMTVSQNSGPSSSRNRPP